MFLLNRLPPRDAAGCRPRHRRSRVLAIEPLERREMLSTTPQCAAVPNLLTISDAEVGAGRFSISIYYSETMNTAIAPSVVFEEPILDYSPPELTRTFTNETIRWSNAKTCSAVFDVADANVASTPFRFNVLGAYGTSGVLQQTYVYQGDVGGIVPPT